MSPTSRLTLALALTAALATAAVAQEAQPADTTSTTATSSTATSSTAPSTSAKQGKTATTSASSSRDVDERLEKETDGRSDSESEAPPRSEQTRIDFERVLRQHPPELATILALDPTLLSNEAFLNGYPELSQFVSSHPEVRRNPKFFLSEYEQRPIHRQSAIDDVLQGIFILTIMSLVAFVIGWILRTIIEQRRWNRLSRVQTEVHTKILDRFGTSDEVLAYIQSPAGSKFLESAPIPLQAADRPMISTPLNRILWSIQIGVVVAVASSGLMLVSTRFDAADAQPLFALGVIAMCVGLGFIASAFASLILSKRLGIWKDPQVAEPEARGLVQ